MLLGLLRAHHRPRLRRPRYQRIPRHLAAHRIRYSNVLHLQRAPHRLIEIHQRLRQIRLRAQCRPLRRRQIARP
jgi:hypothetical protein